MAVADLFGIELAVIQAPMAGAQDHELAIAVAAAGGLGSIPCAMLDAAAIRAQVASFRKRATGKPLNLNFFCHRVPAPDPDRDAAWRAKLAPYYVELGIEAGGPGPVRVAFDAATCEVVEEVKPEVVSFHFGLPAKDLVARVKAIGAKVTSSATTVAEARWLAARGCDAIIAQGLEAGGHRGMFLDEDVAAQVGTFALVPQIVDAVRVPVIAAGGIADARGIVAARMLGASGVQIGTAYLRCPESRISALHRAALATAHDDGTRITNVVSGRPARSLVTRLLRELGPLRDDVPAFPTASAPLGPLRAAAEARGSADFSPLWSGQAAALSRELGAEELTRALVREASELLAQYGRLPLFPPGP